MRLPNTELNSAFRSTDDNILPSSGFTDAVMAEVRREACAPPAIPFPWKHAAPGMAACFAALAFVVAGVFAAARAQVPASTVKWQLWLDAALRQAQHPDTAWAIVAITVTFIGCSMTVALAGE